MYAHKLERPLHCGVSLTMEVLGGKWKACLLSSLQRGVRRPSELHRAHPTATPRVLNQQLRELIGHGMVIKVVHSTVPLVVEYFLTAEGETLLGIVDAIRTWGDAHGDALRARIAALS